ncbi:hypothetical protein AMATHDRAFT_68454 [Amanita thiersii Skay4041]|uniref:Adenine DNA glycosylase n=1 Tax=Amanita thiersii Skay4041 TaxID=703135 RepID=A0A2A9N972_9AGAR|nr:hypothetical protein AMATHDRAFT_68454 [Amanita thiersii Skay4041]
MPRRPPLEDDPNDEDFSPSFGSVPKRKKGGDNLTVSKRRKGNTAASRQEEGSCTSSLDRHSKSLHGIKDPHGIRVSLLKWFTDVHDEREMPWRKRYDPSLNAQERSQRAYEVWVSEVMLQQTQVSTVVPYYNRWMSKFPTVHELAKSNIEEVNALWKGLGYYSRASRLLSGAQKVATSMRGKLPDNAKDLQANIPGIGRYSAGAICSIAYGERVPVLDGNVHRLLSRVLALYAPPKAKATLDLLWNAATQLVTLQDTLEVSPAAVDTVTGIQSSDRGYTQYPGDINQALIELGSTVCKVREPRCDICPLREWCWAFKLAHGKNDESSSMVTDVPDIEDTCMLCEPLADRCTVTVFPMKPDRKRAREELDIVNVIEWRSSRVAPERLFLLVRRPENGLLAGLYEFPTTADVSKAISHGAAVKQVYDWLSKIQIKLSNLPKGRGARTVKFEPGVHQDYQVKSITAAGDVVHNFSHIRKTYRVQWVVLEGGEKPPELAADLSSEKCGSGASFIPEDAVTKTAVWCPLTQVENANIGTGVLKVWNLVRLQWEKEVLNM